MAKWRDILGTAGLSLLAEPRDAGIRKMPERWWISVCPGCNGLVWGGTETHNETCTYRGKMFKPRDVEVVPAQPSDQEER